MAESMEPVLSSWSARRARCERRSARFWGSLKLREALEERRSPQGAVLGPYEAQYTIADGYHATRDIVQP